MFNSEWNFTLNSSSFNPFMLASAVIIDSGKNSLIRSAHPFEYRELRGFIRISMKLIFFFTIFLISSLIIFGQTVSLRGQVTDQNGAFVAGAKVTVNGPSGLVKTAITDGSG